MLWRRATSAYARLCEARLRTPISDTPVALLHDLRYGEGSPANLFLGAATRAEWRAIRVAPIEYLIVSFPILADAAHNLENGELVLARLAFPRLKQLAYAELELRLLRRVAHSVVSFFRA